LSGTVNISRGLFSSEAFRHEVFTEREAWVWLVMEASWKDRTVRAGDYVATTKRGQLAASVRFMAKAWDWTPAKAQRYLKRLEKLKMIRVETDTGVSVVTICKYDEYQSGNKAADTGPIQDRYRTDTNEKKDERRLITDDDSARAVLTFRESVLEAAGHDRSGITANGKVVGQSGEWAEFQKACDDLSISEAEALTVVAETTQRKRDGPATSLRYFKQPLQEFAGAKFAAPLNPITPIKSAQGARNERSIQGDAVVREIATRFADGRIKHDAYD
tara:strand:+ start:4804 stop:5625 length:822 start_codon:yes stop_codon:yes gene_type:complete